jgi:hypothetical protein
MKFPSIGAIIYSGGNNAYILRDPSTKEHRSALILAISLAPAIFLRSHIRICIAANPTVVHTTSWIMTRLLKGWAKKML